MLTALQIRDFRCIESADLEFHPEGTGILGNNASGKTSLLEAIYFLAHGRSFRTQVRDKLLRHGTDSFRLVGRVAGGATGSTVAGMEYRSGETAVRVGGQTASSVSAIAELLAVQVIDPGVHRLIEEGSARRRRLLDWGVFHVKHEFLPTWRRYQRALSQRNAALRTGSGVDVVSAWHAELDASGHEVDAHRREYFRILSPHFLEISSRLLGGDVSLSYRRGWPEDESLAAALERSRDRDLRLGTTAVGPHRADVQFRLRGVAARDCVSRGQQKLLAAAFILAQIKMRATSTTDPVCLLLDDPAAELDVDNLGKLLAVIDEIPVQLVVTSVTQAGLIGIRIGRQFHVEQGQFRTML